jgi:hypothetical protein
MSAAQHCHCVGSSAPGHHAHRAHPTPPVTVPCSTSPPRVLLDPYHCGSMHATPLPPLSISFQTPPSIEPLSWHACQSRSLIASTRTSHRRAERPHRDTRSSHPHCRQCGSHPRAVAAVCQSPKHLIHRLPLPQECLNVDGAPPAMTATTSTSPRFTLTKPPGVTTSSLSVTTSAFH